MKARLIRKFIAVIMTLVLVLQGMSTTFFAEGAAKQVTTTITNLKILNLAKEETNKIFYTASFYLSMDWDASANGSDLKEGDYFTVSLPEQMKLPSDSSALDFNLYAPDESSVMATAHVTPKPSGGGSVKVTFTDWVENKYNVKGNMMLAANFVISKITKDDTNTFKATVNAEVSEQSSEAEIGIVITADKDLNNEAITKWGEKDSDSNYHANWIGRINHMKATLSNAVISDSLLGTGEKFIPESIALEKVVMDSKGFIKSVIEKIDLSDKLTMSEDNQAFTINLGNVNGDQYRIRYKSTYTPGTILKNKLKLTSSEKTLSYIATYRSAASGGSGAGDLANKIKIIKVDSENEQTKLSDAVFKITRVADGKEFEITTNVDGEAITEKLIAGDYKIKELTPPAGFELNDEELTVTVSDGNAVIKTIKNKPVKTSVSVNKKWIGSTEDAATVHLYADNRDTGKSATLNALSGWKYTFDNLRKFDADGSEIEYSVKEAVPKGYKVNYSGNMEEGFVIINTKESTDITAIKRWEGGPSEKPTIWFKLYRKVEGETEVKPVEKIAEEALLDGKASVTWKSLPKTDDNGKEYIYSVKEGELKEGEFIEKAPDNYIKTENGLTVTNKYYSPKIEITGKKLWENEEGKPTAKLQLYKNEKAEGSPVELNADKMEHTWKNLDKTDDDGNEYVYTVKEVYEENGNIKIGNAWYKVTYEGDAQKGFVIKNKKLPPITPMTPPTRAVKVTKLWKDHNGGAISAPTDKITVELYKDGNPTGKKLELTKANNWSGVFKDLEVANGLGSTEYYKYTVKEAGENGNTIKFDGKQYKVIYKGSMKDGLTITNQKEAPPTPSTPSTSTPPQSTSTTPDKPTDTQNTEKPSASNTSISKTLPKTGAEANLSIYAWIMLVSGVLLLLLDYKRRAHTK
ncbi:Cna B-type domain-containing protein [Peptostreptococcus sp. D1]|uniref:Cna B-type domain-containing protein n=1 Tax=Peptostreptococcus sp. D1 TaxID=72304 RepID=UPI0008E1805D|nr:Cna B-type domain-containing protein [Peptostreptococcus sp. D1]SFE54742.1 LPXTG-motif cell wall anchor domain-containing protein [Peptostreptococcus sp. D1]